jgi:DUF4097 and DUF4098 domain-containing protein YvlB
MGTAAGAMVGVGLLAAGALVGFGLTGCGLARSTEMRSYQVDGRVDRLDVDSQDGDVEVRAGDGPVRVTETVHYRGAKPSTTHAVEGGTLDLRNDDCAGPRFNCSVAYLVELPAGTAVKVRTSSGEIRLSGLTGDVTVDTSAGEISGTGLGSAHTLAHTSAGKITLRYTAAPSAVDAKTSAGEVDIRLAGAESYAIDADTRAGHTRIEVPTDPAATRKISAHSSAGGITIGR